MSKKGVLICGHGTRVKRGEEAFLKYTKQIEALLTDYEVEAGFLELSEPGFEEGVKRLAQRGVTEIVAVPVFLFTGVHIQKDIPCMLYQLQAKYNVSISMAHYIGDCDEMLHLSNDLISKALNGAEVEANDTLLFGLGVGASKVAANGDLARLTRMVQETNKYAFSINGYCSRMTYPSVAEALSICEKLPYKNIIVVPYVFFPGVYMDKAHDLLDEFSKQHPDRKVFMAPLLSESEDLAQILIKRLESAERGEVDMISSVDKETLENYVPHHHHGHDHGHHHHHGHDCCGHHH
ncbi:sirohydrochlorin chelatase [Carboxylicivirga mesophila]|uniref:Sirohydrochlorin chelatase n=1 Tax=Carboxylicivirga mesophila TaxID=1166478 RepID=A0ABS5K9S6_9BACT|nr:sirohydrochlorin chelatase [Carboxylicivirga mesophila]MBS2211760.1 sirohydrochlorin chelatase [Carboxylicivirga mesophila]